MFNSLMWDRDEGDGDTSAIFSAMTAPANSSSRMLCLDPTMTLEQRSLKVFLKYFSIHQDASSTLEAESCQHSDSLPALWSQEPCHHHDTDTQDSHGPLHSLGDNTSGHNGWWQRTDTSSMSDTEGLELGRLLSRRVETMTRIRDKEMRAGGDAGGNKETKTKESEMRCFVENVFNENVLYWRQCCHGHPRFVGGDDDIDKLPWQDMKYLGCYCC